MRADAHDSLWTCARIHDHADVLIAVSNTLKPNTQDGRAQHLQTNVCAVDAWNASGPESTPTGSQKSLCLFSEPFALFSTPQDEINIPVSAPSILEVDIPTIQDDPSSQQSTRVDEPKDKAAVKEQHAACRSDFEDCDARLDTMHSLVSSEHDILTVGQTSSDLRNAELDDAYLSEQPPNVSRPSSPSPPTRSIDRAAFTSASPPSLCSPQPAMAPSDAPVLRSVIAGDDTAVGSMRSKVSAAHAVDDSNSVELQPPTAEHIPRQLDTNEDYIAAAVNLHAIFLADTVMQVDNHEGRLAPLDLPSRPRQESAADTPAAPAKHNRCATIISEPTATEIAQSTQDTSTGRELSHERGTPHIMSKTSLSPSLLDTRGPQELLYMGEPVTTVCVEDHADASFATLPDLQPRELSEPEISTSFPNALVSFDDVPLSTTRVLNSSACPASIEHASLPPTNTSLTPSSASAAAPSSAPAFLTVGIGKEPAPTQLLPSAEILASGKKRSHEQIDEDDVSSPERPSVKKYRLEPSPQARKVSSSTSVPENHARAFKKLARPFRSPVVAAKPAAAPTSPEMFKTLASEVSTPPRETLSAIPTPATFKKPASVPRVKTVSRLITSTSTSPVSAAYRSPVFKKLALSPGGLPCSPQSTGTVSILTVQALERRVQILKRALKIMADGGDDELEMLAHKWRTAARSASWDLWDCVKNGGPAPAKQQTRSGYGWGGGEMDEKDKQKGWEEGWGWDDKPEDEEMPQAESDQPDETPMNEADQEVEPQEPTLGKMLMELGIASDTLGWQEEEGDFRDKN